MRRLGRCWETEPSSTFHSSFFFPFFLSPSSFPLSLSLSLLVSASFHLMICVSISYELLFPQRSQSPQQPTLFMVLCIQPYQTLFTHSVTPSDKHQRRSCFIPSPRKTFIVLSMAQSRAGNCLLYPKLSLSGIFEKELLPRNPVRSPMFWHEWEFPEVFLE